MFTHSPLSTAFTSMNEQLFVGECNAAYKSTQIAAEDIYEINPVIYSSKPCVELRFMGHDLKCVDTAISDTHSLRTNYCRKLLVLWKALVL